MHHGRLRKIIITSLLVVLAVSLISYAYYQSRNFISGPQIHISSPQNGSTFEESLITIEGTTSNIARITMNDRQIFVDENGLFSEKLLLLEGYNIITIYAEDKFERTTEKELHLVLSKNTELPDQLEKPIDPPIETEETDLLETKQENSHGNKSKEEN